MRKRFRFDYKLRIAPYQFIIVGKGFGLMFWILLDVVLVRFVNYYPALNIYL